jgi:hypothetical protein
MKICCQNFFKKIFATNKMSVNAVNVKSIPLTTLEGIASTQAFAGNAQAPAVDKPSFKNPHALPNSQKASQHTTIFNQNAGQNFSPVIGSLAQRQHNASLANNPYAGAAATRGNVIASSNASIGSMPTPQLTSHFYLNSTTFYNFNKNNDNTAYGNDPVSGQPAVFPPGTLPDSSAATGLNQANDIVGNYLTGGSTAQIGPAQLDSNVPVGTALLNTGYSYTNPSNENERALAVQVSNDPPTIDVNLDAPRLNVTSGQDMYTFSMNNTNLAQNFNTTMYYNLFNQKALTNDGHQVIPGATISKAPHLF